MSNTELFGVCAFVLLVVLVVHLATPHKVAR
jgi:hypothetical protein